MDILLEILDGPQAGQNIDVGGGLYLNWRYDKIELSDTPSKDLFASINKNAKGVYFLQTNSERISFEINASRVKKIHLLPGISFKFNGVSLRAKALMPELILAQDLNAPPPTTEVDESAAPVNPPKKEGTKKSWKLLLQNYFTDFRVESSKPEKLQVFDPPFELEFVQGLLAEKRLPIFYGPRRAGFGHLDLNIEDPLMPDLAFEIHPTEFGPEIINKAGFKVLLNKRAFEKQILKNGDLIEIGPSVIQVNTLKDVT